jgi:tetratricopeptide (TPR) repeat protein
VLPSLPRDTTKVIVYHRIIQYLLKTNFNNGEARRYVDSARMLSEELNYSRGIAASHYYYAGIEQFESRYDNALYHINQYLQFYREQADSFRIVNGLFSRGKIYKSMSVLDKALEAYYEILGICERTNDNDGMARALGSMAGIFRQNGQFRLAIDHYRKANAIHRSMGDLKNYAMGLQNIGNVYNSLEKYDSAVEFFNDALSHLRLLNVPYEEAIVLGNLGSAHQLLNHYHLALSYQLQALSIKRQLSNRRSLAFTLSEVGVTYLRMRKYREADRYLSECVKLAEEIESKDLLQETYYHLAELAIAENDYRQALRYTQLSNQWKDSIFNETTVLQLNELQTKYESEKKDHQIAILAKENEMQEKEAERQSTLKLASFAGLGLITLLGLIVGYSYHQRLRNQKLLAAKDIELNEANFKREMSELEMKALRAQINPHFLFNCMNSINRMILEGENENASQYLAKFSKLMRLILENAENAKVSLQNELTLLESYIQLEGLRFKGKINYKITIDDTVDVNATYLPSMVLQPFVENAIWHGLMHKDDGQRGMLEISVHEKQGRLYCAIEDNGVGREKARELSGKSVLKTKSMGLRITEERLRLLSKHNWERLINIVDLKDTFNNALGTRVEINFPVS